MGSNMFYNMCYDIKLYKIVKDGLWPVGACKVTSRQVEHGQGKKYQV